MASDQPFEWLEMDEDDTNILSFENFDSIQATSSTYGQLHSQIQTSIHPQRLVNHTAPPAVTFLQQWPPTASFGMRNASAVGPASAPIYNLNQGWEVPTYRDANPQGRVQYPSGKVSSSLASASYGTLVGGSYPQTHRTQRTDVARNTLYDVTGTQTMLRQLEMSDLPAFTAALKVQASAELADNAKITDKLRRAGVYATTSETPAIPQNDSLFQETKEESELICALRKRKRNMNHDAAADLGQWQLGVLQIPLKAVATAKSDSPAGDFVEEDDDGLVIAPQKSKREIPDFDGRGETKKRRGGEETNAVHSAAGKETKEGSQSATGQKRNTYKGDGYKKGDLPFKYIFQPPSNILPWTAVEILTFVPGWIYFRACADRLARNGWTAADICTAILYARPTWNATVPKFQDNFRTTVHHILDRNYKTLYETKEKFANQATGPDYDMTPELWGHRRCSTGGDAGDKDVLREWTIKEITQDVPRDRWPAGEDRGPVTYYLERALKADLDITVTDFCKLTWFGIGYGLGAHGFYWKKDHGDWSHISVNYGDIGCSTVEKGHRNHDKEARDRWDKARKELGIVCRRGEPTQKPKSESKTRTAKKNKKQTPAEVATANLEAFAQALRDIERGHFELDARPSGTQPRLDLLLNLEPGRMASSSDMSRRLL